LTMCSSFLNLITVNTNVKVNRTFVQRFIMCAILIYKALSLAHVNEGSHRFTCHPRVYPHYGMSHPALTLQPQSITALWPVLISHAAQRRRLSWPRLLGEILRWFACPKTVAHPSISRGGRESNSRPSSRKSNALTTRPYTVTCARIQ